ncbi:hypothetical protein D9611_008813 [Ephemerocybe angulata]|uniref:ABM domain-containing protein n=1 Tax=Ephemerocybe angulata TaxID=980116 RepID=A0A8H5CBZ7_9AGAR|nr:hypothetical protein D9611_008813 [Tulosesus angulatus]
MPVVEVAAYLASEALLADPGLARRAEEILAKAEGYISSYNGLQIEDKKTNYLVVVWESLENHETLKTSALHADLVSSLKETLVAGPVTLDFTEFTGEFSNSFDAPVTELCVLNLKEGKTEEQLALQFGALNETFTTGNFIGAHPPATFGELVGKRGTFLFTSGWDRVEDHYSAAGSEAAQAEAARLLELVDTVSLAHVSLTKYARTT